MIMNQYMVSHLFLFKYKILPLHSASKTSTPISLYSDISFNVNNRIKF